MADINTVVRFNEESKAIEVVLSNAGTGTEQVLGEVTAEEWASWPIAEPVEPDYSEYETKITGLESEVEEWKGKFFTLTDALSVKAPEVVPPVVEAPPVVEPPAAE